MSAKPFNPPAFPCEARGDRSVPEEHDYIQTGIYNSKFPGMSLRDWFAGQALAATTRHAFEHAGAASLHNLLPEEWAAKMAYGVADAMLAARGAA